VNWSICLTTRLLKNLPRKRKTELIAAALYKMIKLTDTQREKLEETLLKMMNLKILQALRNLRSLNSNSKLKRMLHQRSRKRMPKSLRRTIRSCHHLQISLLNTRKTWKLSWISDLIFRSLVKLLISQLRRARSK